jgi:hypothetical protein
VFLLGREHRLVGGRARDFSESATMSSFHRATGENSSSLRSSTPWVTLIGAAVTAALTVLVLGASIIHSFGVGDSLTPFATLFGP